MRSTASVGRVALSTVVLGLAFASPSSSARAQATATVSGFVTMGGAPVRGALVRLASSDSSVVTNARGMFTLSGLAAGSDTVIIEHVGSEPDRVPVRLAAGATRTVNVTVSVPTGIDTVDIEALKLKAAYTRVGFDTRRASGQGFYLDQTEIAKRAAFDFPDLLRGATGFRVTTGRGAQKIVVPARGSRCIAYYIDHHRFRELRAGDINTVVRAHEVAAIEAYASNPPAEFNAGSCAAIVIWTKTRLGT